MVEDRDIISARPERAEASARSLDEDEAAALDALCAALLSLKDPDEMRRFLIDLTTPGELGDLAARWRVARLLDAGGMSYRAISEAVGVSTTTVTRVARFLIHEPYQGYRLALDRLKDGDTP